MKTLLILYYLRHKLVSAGNVAIVSFPSLETY